MQTLNFNDSIEYRTYDQYVEAVAFYDMIENGFSDVPYMEEDSLEDYINNL